MNAYDRHLQCIPPDQLVKKLKGALVQVVFTLHFSFMGQEKTNTFRGSILEVKVLKRAPYVMSLMRKGPLRFEEAEVRDDQIEAVKKFLMPKDLRRNVEMEAKEPDIKRRKTVDDTEGSPSPLKQIKSKLRQSSSKSNT